MNSLANSPNCESYEKMALPDANRTNGTLVLLAICVASAMLGFLLGGLKPVSAKASGPLLPRQSDEKLIEISERTDELVEFGNLRLKDVTIAPSRKFSAASLAVKGGGEVGDWLENLEFTLRNKTDKQITYIQFELQLPDTEASGPLMVYREFGIGIHPKAVGTLRGGALRNDEPLALKPGDTAIARLSADHLQRIKRFIALRNFQLADINKVVVKILGVFFDDGLMWSSGHYYRGNSTAPGSYERIDQ
jgi:hypothetical protein